MENKDIKEETIQNGENNVAEEQTQSVEQEDETMDYSNWTEADLELKSFKCPRCDQEFKTTNDLFVHMRETYSDPTICQLCGKNLNCMANILSHSYLHQGIKPYQCPKCKYSTRTRFNLKVHFGSCTGVEKFTYKRGRGTRNGRRKRKTDNNNNDNNRIKKRRTSQNRNNSSMIGNRNIGNNMMYIDNDDLLYQLPDSGVSTMINRDISCLIQLHIQHFPRSINSKQINQGNNANNTNAYYQ